MYRALLTLILLLCAATAPADQYRYYGGKIESEGKTEAMEACEYQELVEKQRCNERMNKSQCIRDVHKECRERFADEAENAPVAAPGTEAPVPQPPR